MLSPTSKLASAGLSRSTGDLERLAESVDITHVNGQVFIHSTIDGIAKPKIVPTGDQARCGIFLQEVKRLAIFRLPL